MPARSLRSERRNYRRSSKGLAGGLVRARPEGASDDGNAECVLIAFRHRPCVVALFGGLVVTAESLGEKPDLVDASDHQPRLVEDRGLPEEPASRQKAEARLVADDVAERGWPDGRAHIR